MKNQTCTSLQLYQHHAVLFGFISNRNVAVSCEPLGLEIKDLAFRQQGSDCVFMLILLEVNATVFISLAISI